MTQHIYYRYTGPVKMPFCGGLMSLAERVRKAREGAGLSQEALAGLIGVHQGTVSGWETGATKRISLSHLKAVAQATGFALEWLRTGEGDEKPPAPAQPLIERRGGAGGFADGYRKAMADVIRYAADKMPVMLSAEELKRLADEAEAAVRGPNNHQPGSGRRAG